MSEETLARIADALERLSPAPPAKVKQGAAAYHWDGNAISIVDHFAPLSLDLLTGVEAQKQALLTNGQRLANGHAAHDILLWGARGAGKSALIKSSIAALRVQGCAVSLVEVPSYALSTLPDLFQMIAEWTSATIIFIDDLAFEGGAESARTLRSVLEGGATPRPHHVRLYVTSNRRHIVARSMEEQGDPINPRDVVDDRLALADRFGLSLGFHVCDQDQYLEMVAGYAAHLGLPFVAQDALTWAAQRGARSGRVAWHYAVELAGRAGKSI